jgi:hypothetical protein
VNAKFAGSLPASTSARQSAVVRCDQSSAVCEIASASRA